MLSLVRPTLLAVVLAVTGTAVSWVRYVDPAEHAFTLDVPAGYQVHGGTVRASPIDPRADIRALSPDGRITLHIGDSNLPNFGEPGPYRREGTTVQLSGGQRLMIARYSPGVEFAYAYGQRLMQATCAKPELKAARPVPNPPRFSYWASTGTTVMSGEAYFLCPDQKTVGYVFASTAETRMQASRIWTVPEIMSLVAPAHDAGPAFEMLQHMHYSLVVDQNWLAQLLRAQGAYGNQTYANYKAELAADADQMRRIDAAQQSNFQAMDNIISGITPTVDPTTGERHDVMNGTGDYHWVDGQGHVTTTKSYIAPSPFAHPLQAVQP
jgi:hypothetical protein